MSDKKEIEALLGRIEKTKQRIAALRDTLRTQFWELKDVVDSLDEADSNFEEATDLFERGLDAMSQYV